MSNQQLNQENIDRCDQDGIFQGKNEIIDKLFKAPLSARTTQDQTISSEIVNNSGVGTESKISDITDEFERVGIHNKTDDKKVDGNTKGCSKSSGTKCRSHGLSGKAGGRAEKKTEGLGSQQEAGEGTSGTTKKKTWFKAPLVQMCIVSVECDEGKAIGVTLDDSPYDFSMSKPIAHYKVIDGILQKNDDTKFRPAAKCDGIHTKKQKKNKQKGTTTITTMSLHTWSRSSNARTRPKCQCNPLYYDEQMYHTDQQYCRLNAIGSEIAAKIWEDQEIEGMVITNELLQ